MTQNSIVVAHFSDIHIAAERGEVQEFRRYLGKRILGTVNLRFLGRGDDFSEARDRFRILLQDLKEQKPDFIISSGDFSAMSFPEEFALVKGILEEEIHDLLPRFAFVPGNHDRYTLGEIWTNHFHREFGAWLQSDIRLAGISSLFPYVRIAGSKLAFIFVDAARFNFAARGKIDTIDLEALERYLTCPELKALTPLLVIHYPAVEADGSVLPFTRRCVNMSLLVEMARAHNIQAMFTGHVHKSYITRTSETGPHIICAGSATHRKHSCYNIYHFTENELLVKQRQYQQEQRCYQPAHQELLPLLTDK